MATYKIFKIYAAKDSPKSRHLRISMVQIYTTKRNISHQKNNVMEKMFGTEKQSGSVAVPI